MAPRSLSRNKVLYARVPVDEIVIVNGPKPLKVAEAIKSLRSGRSFVKMLFTLQTAASTAPFRRHLKVYSIYVPTRYEICAFEFTAIYSGEIVSGLFDILTRQGLFSLD